jgi:hypothetical protein
MRYSPEEFWLSEEQLRATRGSKNGRVKSRSVKRFAIRWYKLPVEVVTRIRKRDDAVNVLFALIEANYESYHHENPIQLTSNRLRQLGISRWQKLRALKILEACGLVSVDRRPGGNPLVTLLWLPLKR